MKNMFNDMEKRQRELIDFLNNGDFKLESINSDFVKMFENISESEKKFAEFLKSDEGKSVLKSITK